MAASPSVPELKKEINTGRSDSSALPQPAVLALQSVSGSNRSDFPPSVVITFVFFNNTENQRGLRVILHIRPLTSVDPRSRLAKKQQNARPGLRRLRVICLAAATERRLVLQVIQLKLNCTFMFCFFFF